MKIIDTNIINRFAKGDIDLDLSESFYTTEEVRNEIENFKSMSDVYKAKVNKVRFINIENHDYYSESKYLENYKKFINKYNNMVSFYGLKSLSDISILSCVDVLLKPLKPNLFNITEKTIEILTNDQDLKDALKEEFGDKIIINDPVL